MSHFHMCIRVPDIVGPLEITVTRGPPLWALLYLNYLYQAKQASLAKRACLDWAPVTFYQQLMNVCLASKALLYKVFHPLP